MSARHRAPTGPRPPVSAGLLTRGPGSVRKSRRAARRTAKERHAHMESPQDGWPGREDDRRTSDVLRRFIADFPGDRVSVADLTAALGDRAYGVLLFVFAPIGRPSCRERACQYV